jgi:hypothetical protein
MFPFTVYRQGVIRTERTVAMAAVVTVFIDPVLGPETGRFEGFFTDKTSTIVFA